MLLTNMPTIRVTDETYKLVERYAKKEGTTLQDAALILIVRGFGCATILEEIKQEIHKLVECKVQCKVIEGLHKLIAEISSLHDKSIPPDRSNVKATGNKEQTTKKTGLARWSG